LTQPVNVDHDELIQLADGHVVLVDELSGGRPPEIKGDWPSSAAAQAALGGSEAAKSTMSSQLGSDAAALKASANGYQKQDVANAIKLGDIGAIIGPFTGLAGQVTQALSGILGSATQAAVYPVTGVVGAVTAAVTTSSHHEPAVPNGTAALTPTEDHPDVSHSSPPPVHVGHAGR
jgi:hypothetical protein